ncbi:MAG TPA: YetF domain-containing protein [Saprospiraceae bacterium]|nr:YetF domain-containing protein [Saprospiraceae bacterium]
MRILLVAWDVHRLIHAMYYLDSGFNWKALLLGSENWGFLPEMILRTFIMFAIIIVSLRILGKRGVKQLSIFELVVIISLGSAAGDPMLYKEVGLLTAMIVFIIIVGLYSLITYIIGQSPRFEKIMEGEPVILIKNGAFSIDNFSKEALGEDEFFSELRMQGVSQLGQIEEAILESSGSISIFYYPEMDVKYGLPIMPESLVKRQENIVETGYYACVFCGYTEKLEPTKSHTCPACQKWHWVKASDKKRIR